MSGDCPTYPVLGEDADYILGHDIVLRAQNISKASALFLELAQRQGFICLIDAINHSTRWILSSALVEDVVEYIGLRH
jgi:hypothetical protein